MASILKVDTIQDQSGNNIINESADTITIGASGDTITIPTGATMTVPNGGLTGQNYPAFEAYLSADQTVSDGVTTLIEFDTEVFDTDSAFDTATYKFTVPTGKDGKYFIFSRLSFSAGTVTNLNNCDTNIYLNGSVIGRSASFFSNSDIASTAEECTMILDLSAGDYIEVYGRLDINSGTALITAGSGARILDSVFGAYRIGD